VSFYMKRKYALAGKFADLKFDHLKERARDMMFLALSFISVPA